MNFIFGEGDFVVGGGLRGKEVSQRFRHVNNPRWFNNTQNKSSSSDGTSSAPT